MSIRNAVGGLSTAQIQDNAYSRCWLLCSSGNTTIAAATTAYLQVHADEPSGAVDEGGTIATENGNDFFFIVAPVAGTILGIAYGVTGAPGVGETFTGRLRQSEANFGTDVVVTISNPDVAGSFATDVSFSAGDQIGCQVVTSAGAAAVYHNIGALLRFEE